MQKGMTPIVASVILLLITVALAGTAWSYLSGITSSQMKGSFTIPSGGGGAICRIVDDCAGSPARDCAEFLVLVTNSGQDELTFDDFIIRQIDSNTIPESLSGSATHEFPSDGITTGESAKVLKLFCTIESTSNCSTAGFINDPSVGGLHTIRIGTGASSIALSVNCPG
ncbi:MAG: hypothetical protein KKA90_04940 [Nanoarchaeota archaeon]|nr:hypothetical protein [Nanoarchaeota archaeon]